MILMTATTMLLANIGAIHQATAAGDQSQSAPVAARPHSCSLPTPPPPPPWDNAELGIRMGQLRAELDDNSTSTAYALIRARQMIEALPPTPSEAMVRAARVSLMEVEANLERVRAVAVRVHALGLVAARNISEQDANRVAWFYETLTRPSNFTRQIDDLRARLERAAAR